MVFADFHIISTVGKLAQPSSALLQIRTQPGNTNLSWTHQAHFMKAANQTFDGQGHFFVLLSSSPSPHSYAVVPGLQNILAAAPSL